MNQRIGVMGLLVACGMPVVCGCGGDTPAAAEPAAREPLAAAFDPAMCGTVTGRVVWPTGKEADAPDFIYGVPLPDGHFNILSIPNPNKPDINLASQGLRGAVVFLRNVDPGRAKAWDLPAVRVELKDRDIRIVQGDANRRVGFVRVGDTVAMATAEPVLHSLRGRGASFFSFTFTEPNQPMSRTLHTPGVVELTSGSGFYWANAHVFVADHPYYTVTGTDGSFTLTQVPAGEVELVVWHPGWTVSRQERNPESGLIIRQSYGPPLEVTHAITVRPGQSQSVTVAVP